MRRMLMGVFAALGLVACGPAEDVSENGSQDLGTEEARICGMGYFYCPTDMREFWYESLACPRPVYRTPAKVLQQCEAYCDVECGDGGWQTPEDP
ncbi:hypothetical protein MYSTI_05265 [Myxococcus stipitatus DSM 14675]|uniref:Lipoprotein n=1 Tax=Myxococcus stipitatus (strain DSM 14675 / JCM 12634 / Mx s8) TaxID=1278073 RepID=L7UCC7_MYXSD|nr:hypothetical protein [Myxococcus stipitatus]AGC46546.1 hypothetical protein MYSTI_05265 [Myxococcus stipitatus DSM 14675]